MKMSMEHWWNYIDRSKPKYWRKTCPDATLSTASLTQTKLGSAIGRWQTAWAMARHRRYTAATDWFLQLALSVCIARVWIYV